MTEPIDEQPEEPPSQVDLLEIRLDVMESNDETRETELVSARAHAERVEIRLAEIEKQIQIWRTGSDD
jgi:hypothetical protein